MSGPGGTERSVQEEVGIGVVSACASSEDPDLALARILQEQERALYLLSYNNGNEADHGFGAFGAAADPQGSPRRRRRSGDGEAEAGAHGDGSEGEEGDDDDDAVVDDAALAARLQRMEDQSTMAELMAAQMRAISQVRGGGGRGRTNSDGAAALDDDEEFDGEEDDGERSEDDDDEEEEDDPHTIDLDSMTYEQLTALGEVVGTASRGMEVGKMDDVLVECTYAEAKVRSAAMIAERAKRAEHRGDAGAAAAGAEEVEVQCAICREEYADEDTTCILPCAHFYHSACVREWLKINRTCPVCGAEAHAEGVTVARY